MGGGGEGGVLLKPKLRSNNYEFQEKMCRGHDAVILTMPYLKFVVIVWFHKSFNLFFLKQPSCLRIKSNPFSVRAGTEKKKDKQLKFSYWCNTEYFVTVTEAAIDNCFRKWVFLKYMKNL